MTAEDLELLDLSKESSMTSILFICNLLLMILMLFILVGVLVITAVVSYAGDEVEMLHEMRGYDSSIFLHNLYQFLTLMPTILIVIQVLTQLFLILLENQEEVYFYVRDNGQGMSILKGILGLSLLLLSGMLFFRLSQLNHPAGQHDHSGAEYNDNQASFDEIDGNEEGSGTP